MTLKWGKDNTKSFLKFQVQMTKLKQSIVQGNIET